jgi:Flp pilus assembly protein TadD
MLRLGRPELARRHFEAALLASPGTPPILIRLGEVALRAGRFADAEARARGALAAAPDDVRANLLLAAAHHAQGRSALASDGYRRVLALDPDNHDARENLRRLQSGKVR